MGKAMKAMKAMKASGTRMTASGIYDAISTTTGLKRKEVKGVFESLCDVATDQVKRAGKFVIPGITMLKLKNKPARKACSRMMFGTMTKIAAKPASKAIKSFPVKSLKDSI